MNILQRSNFLIFFDDVRVDPYVINWNVGNGLYANNATAAITMFRTDAMDDWKAYLTQVKVFGENPFTRKFTMLFDGEIVNRSWNDSRSNMGQVTFQAKGYYHWLDIQVPMGIQSTDEFDPLLKFIYEAQNINIDEVRTLITPNSELLLKDKSIEEIIDQLFEKLTIGYYDVSEEDTAFAFAKVKERFKVMVEVLPEFREAGFLDLFTFTKTTQMSSFYVYLNQVLTQLMFEFYQDRDGTFRIKTPSWNQEVMKSHIIDSSIIDSISGLDDWENEPTRVLAIGAETQYNTALREKGLLAGETISNLTIPVGLYIGNPQDPDNEEYYSTQIQKQLEDYGVTGLDVGAGAGGPAESFSGEWFDNITDKYLINSGHKSVNASRPKHNGTDYNFRNEPVYNIGSYGTVTGAGRHLTMGNWVKVEQTLGGKLYTFRYMHFSSPAIVKVGDSVSPGQKLGTSGSTGRDVTGPHLHFEVWVGKTDSGTSLNPDKFLRENTGSKASANASAGYKGPGGPQDVSGGNGTASSIAASSGTTGGKALGGFEITAYVAFCDTGCIGITKEGWNVKDNTIDHRVIAVDPTVIPLGSIVEVGSFGLFNAVDTGGAIKGKKIDILVHNTAYGFKVGRQKNIPVKLIRSGYGDKTRVPPTKIGTLPTFNGSTGSSSSPSGTAGTGLPTSYSSPYANVDGVALGFKKMDYSGITGMRKTVTTEKTGEIDKRLPKGVAYSASTAATIPTYGSTYASAIKSNEAGVSPKLVAGVIQETSAWRENYEEAKRIGIMGLPSSYVSSVLNGQNVKDPNNNIAFGTEFLKSAMERFNGKVTFGLAAYYIGNLISVQEITESVGLLDFSKSRTAFDSAFPGTTDFVDAVIAYYVGTVGNYISGDPHVDFGSVRRPNMGQQEVGNETDDNVVSENSELPEYGDLYKPRLSDEERMYKINLVRVEQALIRADSPAVASGGAMSADRLIFQYAKYNMQLHRAKTHNVNVSLTTMLPFLRPGYNAWIEPTRKDIICYITGIQHTGSFQSGCRTSFTGGFVRSPDNYQDVDSSIFIGEMKSDSTNFGETLPSGNMQTLRNELNAMHGTDVIADAHEFSVLKKLYSSHTGNDSYTTEWNKDYSMKEITDMINKSYASAPPVIVKRKTSVADAIEKSEKIFIEKLLKIKN